MGSTSSCSRNDLLLAKEEIEKEEYDSSYFKYDNEFESLFSLLEENRSIIKESCDVDKDISDVTICITSKSRIGCNCNQLPDSINRALNHFIDIQELSKIEALILYDDGKIVAQLKLKDGKGDYDIVHEIVFKNNGNHSEFLMKPKLKSISSLMDYRIGAYMTW